MNYVTQLLLIFVSGTNPRTNGNSTTIKPNKTGLKLGLLILFIGMNTPALPQGFKNEQLKFSRVRAANKEKAVIIDSLLLKAGLKKTDLQLCLRAFKKEQKLRVYGKNEGHYTLIKCEFLHRP